MPKKPKEGDIIEIPLSNGEKAYCWYLNYSQMGPIIQVQSLRPVSDVTVDQILDSKPLFPPIITGLFAMIKEGKWKVIGHKPVTNFVHPKFVLTSYDEQTGKAGIWFLWDGQKDIRIGPTLPEK